MNDDAIKSLCDAAMLAGIQYARQRGIEMTDDVSARFLSILRPAIKVALTRAMDDAREPAANPVARERSERWTPCTQASSQRYGNGV